MEDQLTKQKFSEAQQQMIDAGYPPSLFMTLEDRKKVWDENPPKPLPAFNKLPDNATDQDTLKVLAEFEEAKKTKTSNRIAKMLDKKVDRTGQRWDGRKGKWVTDNIQAKVEQAMISITTNTRGSTKMATKDFADMNLAEMAEAYNKISGKDPIKKFKDKATGLKRLAEASSKKAAEKATAPKAAATGSDTVRKPKAEPKEGSANKRAAEFGCRVGSFREKLIIALDESYKKLIPELDLLKAVYGSKNTENAGALTMVVKGANIMIEKNNLPYILKKEKNEAKEISYGLFPK